MPNIDTKGIDAFLKEKHGEPTQRKGIDTAAIDAFMKEKEETARQLEVSRSLRDMTLGTQIGDLHTQIGDIIRSNPMHAYNYLTSNAPEGEEAVDALRGDKLSESIHAQYPDVTTQKDGYKEQAYSVASGLIERLPKSESGAYIIDGYEYSYPEAVTAMQRVVEDTMHPEMWRKNAAYRDHYTWKTYGKNYKGYVEDRFAAMKPRLQALEAKIEEKLKGYMSTVSPLHKAPDMALLGMASAQGADKLRKVKDLLQSVEKNNLWRGLDEGFDALDAASLGISSLLSNVQMTQVLGKVYNDEPLTDTEQIYYDLWGIENELEDIRSIQGQSGWNTIGTGLGTTMGMAPSFFLGMGATQNIFKLSSLGVKGALEATKAAGKKGIMKGIGRGLLETGKIAGRSVSNILKAEAMGLIAAPFLPSTWSEFASKRGDQFAMENGKLVYRPKAAWKDAANALIEQGNELAGEFVGGRISDILGGSASMFGRMLGLDKWASKVGISATARRILGYEKPQWLKVFQRNIGYTGALSEPLSEVWGDVASNLMKSVITGKGRFDYLNDWEYWRTTLAVSAIYGGAVNLSTMPLATQDYSKKRKVRNAFLGKVKDQVLRDQLLSISAMDDIEQMSKELAHIDYTQVNNVDLAYGMDFLLADMDYKVAIGDAKESARMQQYKGVIQDAYTMAYRGVDGNTPHNAIVSAEVEDGTRYIVISGDTTEGADAILMCLDANGNSVPIHRSKVKSIGKISLEDSMAEGYKKLFATDIEIERQQDIIRDFKALENPSAQDVSRVMTAFGVTPKSVGETATLVDGSEVVVEGFNEESGKYLVKDAGDNLLDVPFYDILSEDALIAEAQGFRYSKDSVDDMEISLTQEEAIEENVEPLGDFNVGDIITTPSGTQGRIVGFADGKVMVDENTDNIGGSMREAYIEEYAPEDITKGYTAPQAIQDEVTPIPKAEEEVVEMPQPEAEIKVVPVLEDGSVDYDSITDAQQFAELYTKERGTREMAAQDVASMQSNVRDEITSLEQKAQKATTPNERIKIQKEIGTRTEKVAFYDNVLDILAPQNINEAQPQVSETMEEGVETPEANDDRIGIVENEYSVRVPKDEAKVYSAFADMLGVQVIFVDKVVEADGTRANAKIDGNKVYVGWKERDSDKTTSFLIGHEFTHRMQDLSPEVYEVFKESVREFLGEDEWNTRIARIQSAYRAQNTFISAEQIEDEVVADFVGKLVAKKDVFAKYVEAHKTNKSLLEKIADIFRAIRDFLRTKGVTEKRLDEVIENLNTLIESAASAEATGNGQRERFSIIGEQGASALDMAEEATIRMDNLAVAREMEERGDSALNIRMATGWERGADGLWRYEIEENIPKDFFTKNLDVETTLGEILGDNHQYFKAYPSLADIKVLFSSMPYNETGVYGGYNPINRSLLMFNSGENLETFVHEIQHAIQVEEGFAIGGGEENFRFEGDTGYIQGQQYIPMNLILENKTRKYVGKETAIKYGINSDFLDILDKEGLKESYEARKNEIPEMFHATLEDIINNPDIISREQVIPIIQKVIDDAIAKAKDAAHAQYKRIAGEVESRNVEHRLNMTPEERRATLLSKTEDVAREDQIFLRWGVDIAMKEAEVRESTERLREQGAIIDAERGDVRYSIADVLAGDQREQAIADLMRVTGRSRRTVISYLKAEESLANIILSGDNKAFLDIQVDESVPSIWSNSDYPQGTVEFSNICRKRLPFTMIYQRLQKDFPNTVFDASSLESIRQTLIANGEEVACGLCFVEDRRQLLGEIGQGFIKALKGEAIELNDKQQEAIARMRESGDTYIPNLYELITLDGMKILRKEHPEIANAFVAYNNARGMQAGRLFQAYSAYHRDILNYDAKKVAKINNAGGLRIFSFSDFEAHHLIDLVQVLTDCAAKGIKVQGYTKVPQFAKAVKDTKMKVNRSLIAKAKGVVDADYIPQEGEAVSPNVVNGKRLLFDTVEGIDVNNPNFFDSTVSKNVGNILVGISDEHIRIAMLDPFVDYIIGFHTGLSEAIREQKGIADWTNYKYTQLEKILKDGKLVNADKHGINIYTEVLTPEIKTERQFVRKYLKVCEEKGWIPKYHRFLNKSKSGKFIYTKGYYKLLLDFKMFDANGRILPQEVVVPVFDNEVNARILEEYVEGEKAKAPNDELYGKVVDAMVERGVLTEAQVGEAMSQPKFSLQTIKALSDALSDYNTNGDIVAFVDAVREANDKFGKHPYLTNVVMDYEEEGDAEWFVSRIRNVVGEANEDYAPYTAGGVRYSLISPEMDASYLDAVERGDMAAAQRMVMEAAERAGYTIRAYHGTPNKVYNPDWQDAVAEIVTILFPNEGEINMDAEYGTDEYRKAWDLAAEIRYNYREYREKLPKTLQRRFERGITKPFTVFDTEKMGSSTGARDANNGFFFSPNPLFASSFRATFAKDPLTGVMSKTSSGDGVLYDVFIKPNNLLDLRSLPATKSKAKQMGNTDGYDVVINKVKDGRNRNKVEEEIMVKDPTLIKSADPVTYDDAGNVIPLSERFNPAKEDIRYSIIGEIGAANLDTYGRYGSPMLALEMAREFEAEGKTAREIRLATNWERGKDGKWRYEIMDGVYRHPQDDDIAAKEYRLADILDNPDLYKAYPYLKDLKVSYNAEMAPNGRYNGKGIELKSTRTPEQINSTLIHEVQHAIQYAEMFAKGGSVKSIAKELVAEGKQLAEEFKNTPNVDIIRKGYLLYQIARKAMDSVKADTKATEAYRSLAGEVEARNTQKRMGMTEEQRLETLLSATEDVARDAQRILFYEAKGGAEDARYSVRDGMSALDNNTDIEEEIIGDEGVGSTTEEQVHTYLKHKHYVALDNIRKRFKRLRDIARANYKERERERRDRIGSLRTNAAKIDYILGELDELSLPLEHQALVRIARGEIRIKWENSEDGTKRGIAAEVGLGDGERRLYTQIADGATLYFDEAVHQWWQMIDGYSRDIDTQDLRNALIEALSTAHSPKMAITQLRDIYNVEETTYNESIALYDHEEELEVAAERSRYDEDIAEFEANKDAMIREYEERSSFFDAISAMSGTVADLRKRIDQVKEKAQRRVSNIQSQYREMRELIARVKAAVKDAMTAENMRSMQSSELRKLVNKVDKARSIYEVENILVEVESIMLDASIRTQRMDMDRMLRLRLPNGESVELWVDEQMSEGKLSAKEGREILDNMWKGKNASGVSVASRIDKTTANTLTYLRKLISPTAHTKMVEDAEATERGTMVREDGELKLSQSSIAQNEARMAELEEKKLNNEETYTSADAEEYTARSIYDLYLRAVMKKQDIQTILESIQDVEEMYYGNPEKNAVRDHHIECLREEIVETKKQYLEALKTLNEEMLNLMRMGREALRSFRAMEQAHKEHIVKLGLDALGVGVNIVEDLHTSAWDRTRAFVRGTINAPYWTFQTTLKEIDHLAPNGEGDFYNHFMYGMQSCADQFYVKHSAHIAEVAQKMRTLLKKKGNDGPLIADVIEEADSKIIATITYGKKIDRGEIINPETYDLTISNAMYLIAMWRQPRYRQSMLAHGITQEAIDAVYNAINAENAGYIPFMDWVNDTFLPDTRLEYDKVHKQMFGVSMAEERNYFPARVIGYEEKQDISLNEVGMLPSTITGAVVQRVRNTLMPDFRMNYFKVLMGHLVDMDQWSSYAPMIRDLNALCSNTLFREKCNKVMSGRGAKGDGSGSLFQYFKTTAAIAVNCYRPQKNVADDFIIGMLRGWAGSNIAFRGWTAIKQITSSPVFGLYMLDGTCQKLYVKNMTYGIANMRKLHNWALENSPSYKQRWESKFAGMDVFTKKVGEENGYGVHSKFKSSKVGKSIVTFEEAVRTFAVDLGLTPNAAVDAFSVMTGIKTIYDYELQKLIERDGVTEPTEGMKKVAMLKAEVVFNSTQQSGENIYLSQVQKDRTFATSVLTVYLNSSFGFHRLRVTGAQELWRQRYDKEYLKAIREKYGDKADEVLAEARTKALSQLSQGVMGDLLFALMSGGGTIGAFTMFGGDDDEGEIWDETKKALFVGVVNTLTGGYLGGSILSNAIQGYKVSLATPFEELVTDIQKVYKLWQKAYNEEASYLAAFGHTMNIATKFRYGLDFETLSNIVVGLTGLFDGSGGNEAVMNILNVPQSQIMMIAGRRREGETTSQYITRIRQMESVWLSEDDTREGELERDYNTKALRKDIVTRVAGARVWRDIEDLEGDYEDVVKKLGWTPNARPNNRAWETGVYVAPVGDITEEEFIALQSLQDEIAYSERYLTGFAGTDENYYALLKEITKLKNEIINKYEQFK